MRNTQLFTEIESFVADLYRGRNFTLKPYFYVVSFAAGGIGALLNATQKINGNADFVLVQMYANLALGASEFQMTDTSSQETLFNTPTPFANVVGSNSVGGYDGNNIGFMKLLAANSNQMLSVANATGGTTDAFNLILCGAQVFTY